MLVNAKRRSVLSPPGFSAQPRSKLVGRRCAPIRVSKPRRSLEGTPLAASGPPLTPATAGPTTVLLWPGAGHFRARHKADHDGTSSIGRLGRIALHRPLDRAGSNRAASRPVSSNPSKNGKSLVDACVMSINGEPEATRARPRRWRTCPSPRFPSRTQRHSKRAGGRLFHLHAASGPIQALRMTDCLLRGLSSGGPCCQSPSLIVASKR
jgi:hypothetical protein